MFSGCETREKSSLPFSRALKAVSSKIRCCGSIALASVAEIPKNGASKRPRSSLTKCAPGTKGWDHHELIGRMSGVKTYVLATLFIPMIEGLQIYSIFRPLCHRTFFLLEHGPETVWAVSCLWIFERKANDCDVSWGIPTVDVFHEAAISILTVLFKIGADIVGTHGRSQMLKKFTQSG